MSCSSPILVNVSIVTVLGSQESAAAGSAHRNCISHSFSERRFPGRRFRSCNRYAGRRRRADLCSEQEDFRLLHSRTAVLMPICNENVARLFAGLEASYRSLAATSELRHFDFYVFSDTRDPDRQVEEEVAWAQGRQTRAMKNPTVRAADRSSSAEVSWQNNLKKNL